ncbi:GNAT family N-acetyltransferase [Nocardia sp. NBC_01009]|uniref:GNAT family N-acetyltransferase n=1 Tax=Nocardia sp. NBC_01009 TaxID=2975996 RepID=UPI003864AFE9|nr:GNAT family N-acetyltransferase [Nocardia sp. NBC_01009]
MEERLLSDETVWLSPPTAADTDTIVECCQDPAIAAWVTIPVPYHREHAEQFLDEFVTRGWAADNPTWALRLQADGPVIGMIALGAVDESAREIGFWLVPEHRERGLMSRAITLVCNFGFDPDGMALARITWHAFVGNHASAAAVRRNGFRYEGLARLGGLQRGVRRDSWLAARLATDPPGYADGWPQGV